MNPTLALDAPHCPPPRQVRFSFLRDSKQLPPQSPFLYLALVRRRQFPKTRQGGTLSPTSLINSANDTIA